MRALTFPPVAGDADRVSALHLGLLALMLLGILSPASAQQTETPAPEAPAAEVGAGEAVESEPEPEPVDSLDDGSSEGKLMSTLRALRSSIETMKAALDAKREELADPEVPADRKAVVVEEIDELNREIGTMERNFEEFASGIDFGTLRTDDGEDVDLGGDMREFLSPIVTELKDLTARPREIEALRRSISQLDGNREKAVEALDNVRRLLARVKQASSSPALKLADELEEVESGWLSRLAQIDNDLEVAHFQLDERFEDSKSVFGTVRDMMASFFRTRGRNLLFAGLAFGIVIFLSRMVHGALVRWTPLRRVKQRSFYLRLANIIYFATTVVIAVLAGLMVLYSAADWVLLGVAVLFIAGLAWTGKHTLPRMYHQVKLMLNLGPVREGERLVYEGVPWKVKQIRFYTDLVNERLEGGVVRLPISTLAELHSRPFGTREPWFPCESGQWVLLSDGVFGRVVLQTPEWVELVLLGGSRKTYPTGDFVALSPENLSRNFRIESVFGIDYAHQSIATTGIPKRLVEKLTSGIRESGLLKSEDELIHLSVEFSAAAASSLDYTVLADFKGSAAQNYNKLLRLVAKLCVEACNEHGWVIPFTQVTLHQAVASSPMPVSEPEK